MKMLYTVVKSDTSMVNYAFPVFNGKKSTNGSGTLSQPLVVPLYTILDLSSSSQFQSHPELRQATVVKWGTPDPENIYVGATFVFDINYCSEL